MQDQTLYDSGNERLESGAETSRDHKVSDTL